MYPENGTKSELVYDNKVLAVLDVFPKSEPLVVIVPTLFITYNTLVDVLKDKTLAVKVAVSRLVRSEEHTSELQSH